MRCSASGHVEKKKNANKALCSHRIASGVPRMGSWAGVRLWSVTFGEVEGLHLYWGPLVVLLWSGTPAKWADEMTPYMAYNPTKALYTPSSALGPTFAYALI